MSTPIPTTTRRIVPLLTSLEDTVGLEIPDSAALQVCLQNEAATLDDGAAWLIAWLDYVVLVGLVTAEQVRTRQVIEPCYLQELRLFGKQGEWRLRRTGAHFQARRRRDGTGTASEVLDDDQSLWGTQVLPGGAGWTTLVEGRGIRYDLPLEVRAGDVPLRLQVRNYLGRDAAGMVGVTDNRLIGICNQQGQPLIGKEDVHA